MQKYVYKVTYSNKSSEYVIASGWGDLIKKLKEYEMDHGSVEILYLGAVHD